MKSLFKIFFLFAFFSKFNTIYSDEFDDLVSKIMTKPENLFTYMCDTNNVDSDNCKQIEIYGNAYQSYIDLFNECKTAKLLDKNVEITDSIWRSYNFYYDFPQYHKELLISFFFQKEYKSGKMKLRNYSFTSKMKDDFFRKVIENPDSLNHYLMDTNYIDTLFWIFTTKDSIKKIKKYLNYIKRNKLKLLRIDHLYNQKYYFVSYADPKNNSILYVWFHYEIDSQTRKYKIMYLEFDEYLNSNKRE